MSLSIASYARGYRLWSVDASVFSFTSVRCPWRDSVALISTLLLTYFTRGRADDVGMTQFSRQTDTTEFIRLRFRRDGVQ